MITKMTIYENLAAIGVAIASKKYSLRQGLYVDIDKALIDAAQAINEGNDQRILSLVLSWIKLHGEQVNIERLKKLMKQEKNPPLWIHLFAFFGLSCGQSR